MTELERHILYTYLNVRYGMVIIGALFPVVVGLVGWLDGVPELLGSLSRYYWAVGGGDYLARIWFCGGLLVLASLLYLYKGFSSSENIALNIAAAFAVGVVVFPTDQTPNPEAFAITTHGLCAGGVFACLAYVVWFRAKDTLAELPPHDRPKYRGTYTVLGALMALTPVTAYVLNAYFGGESFISLSRAPAYGCSPCTGSQRVES
jgi:hypothetical protein